MNSDLSALARFISDLRYDTIPDNVRQATVLHILDTVAVSVGAIGNSQIQNITSAWLVLDDTKAVSVWGQNKRTGLTHAAFLNALQGHTLELDDVHTDSKTHIGTVVVPAAWALAEHLGRSGRDLVTAVVCGYETMSRIGMALGVSAHRNAGWHVTATAGVFGAAAACAKLLELDEEKTVYALALGGSLSFGTWAFLGDGSTSKVLNPAHASASGAQAALLARAGMTGPAHIFSSNDGGLFSMMTPEPRPELLNKDLGSVWQSLYVDNKPYPACRSTHCAIDATLRLVRTHDLRPDDIDRAEVDTYLVGYKQCAISEGSLHPTIPVHAKFSTQYCVACAIVHREVTLRQFEPAVIADSTIQNLLTKVTVREKSEFTREYPAHWGCTVRLYTKDGRTFEQYMRDASGSVDNPLTPEQVHEKAVSIMRETIGNDAAQALSGRLLDIAKAEKVFAL